MSQASAAAEYFAAHGWDFCPAESGCPGASSAAAFRRIGPDLVACIWDRDCEEIVVGAPVNLAIYSGIEPGWHALSDTFPNGTGESDAFGEFPSAEAAFAAAAAFASSGKLPA
jgi:hypothetical protein